MRRSDLPIVLTASLVFADATIVTLVLPNLLVDLHTTVYGVAAVLAVYTAALGCAAPFAPRLLQLGSDGRTAVAALGLFAIASVVCALAGSLGVLLAARAAQGLAGAVILTVAGASLAPRDRAARAWVLIGVLSAAAGPVVGGALTQAFSWRAIFVAQAPVPLVTAALWKSWFQIPPVGSWPGRRHARPLLVLGLVSGALTALLFGVVLLLVVGWAMRPLSAALAVTLVPLAALAGALLRGRTESRIVAGCALIGGGVGAFAFLPSNDVGWLIAPELVAGLGMGLALMPLLEHVLPERIDENRAANLAVRHLAITLALLALAPIIAHDLDAATERAKLRTVAVVLDAPIDPGRKLRLAPVLVASVHSNRPLAAVREDARKARSTVAPADRPRFDAMFDRVETVFVSAAADAFHRAFLVAAAFAFLAAAVLAFEARRVAAAGVALGLAAVGAQALADRYAAPSAVAIADPCQPRSLPRTGGIGGVTQTVVLRALDVAACRLGASREELVLAVADRSEADRFRRRHGFSPRSVQALLRLIGVGFG
jgi:predicted MFS family arabinose efflux permease